MADPFDPFKYDPESAERTVIRPTPGRDRNSPSGARKASPSPTPTPTPSHFPTLLPEEAQTSIDLVTLGTNPIVAAANPLIALAARLRDSATQDDIPALRDRVVRELKRFDQKVKAAGVQQPEIGHFALCALIDDLVLNTPWGAASNWMMQTLAAVFHQKWRDAGVRFYEVLDKLEDDPSAQIDLLELMYLCLSLGFVGMLRSEHNGAAKLARRRETLYGIIRRQRGDFERELSPHWQGIPAGHKPLGSAVPLWVFALASAAFLMAVFIAFSWFISDASNPAFAEIAQLPPAAPVVRSTPPAPESAILRTLRIELAPEIMRGIVEVRDDAATISVAIRGSGSFPVGSANLEGPYASIIGRIGVAIQYEPGRVTVSGHTDSTPIHTIRFPSNYELSLARAEAARNVIRSKLPDPERVVAEGRGDSEPVASNATPEGREQNRRIEVAILKRPAG